MRFARLNSRLNSGSVYGHYYSPHIFFSAAVYIDNLAKEKHLHCKSVSEIINNTVILISHVIYLSECYMR